MLRTKLLLILPLVVAVTFGQTNRGYGYYGTSNVRDQRPQPIYGNRPLLLPMRPVPVQHDAVPVAPTTPAPPAVPAPVATVSPAVPAVAPAVPAEPVAPSYAPVYRPRPPLYTSGYRPLLPPRPIRPVPPPSQPPVTAVSQSTLEEATQPLAVEEINSESPVSQPEPTLNQEPIPEPLIEPSSEPVSQPEPFAETEPVGHNEPILEPVNNPQPELAPRPEPVPQPQPVAETEPVGHYEPILEPVNKPQLELAPRPEPVPQPQPVPELEPVLLPEPVHEAEPVPLPKPVSQPQPISQPQPVYYEPISEPVIAPQPEPAPLPEPIPQPKPVTQPEPVITSEPVLEPEKEPKPIPVAPAKPMPVAQPPLKPQLEPVAIRQPSIAIAPIASAAPAALGALPPLLPKPKPIREPAFGRHPQPTISPTSYYPTPSYPRSTPAPPVVVTENPYPPVTRPTGNLKIDFQCKEGNGFYSVINECDTYIECKEDKAIKYSCPDGLHFNPAAKHFEYPCAYPSEVQCIAGAAEQNPKPTEKCPNQYGYYSMNDGDCSKFIMCQEGLATIMDCPMGLVFNPQTSSCDWPANVPQCNPNVFKDFTCPDPPQDEYGQISDIIQHYRYGENCKLYVACHLGHPRLLSCDRGLSFDDASQSCIDEDFVTDCAIAVPY